MKSLRELEKWFLNVAKLKVDQFKIRKVKTGYSSNYTIYIATDNILIERSLESNTLKYIEEEWLMQTFAGMSFFPLQIPVTIVKEPPPPPNESFQEVE
jgi:hypothetical protein